VFGGSGGVTNKGFYDAIPPPFALLRLYIISRFVLLKILDNKCNALHIAPLLRGVTLLTVLSII
jgi:hypothetical protein